MKNVAERKQRFVARTRADILNAAARAFARTGYQSVTMRDIAREAGYTAAALYTYFENKQEIVAALVKLVVDEFLEQLVLRADTLRARADEPKSKGSAPADAAVVEG